MFCVGHLRRLSPISSAAFRRMAAKKSQNATRPNGVCKNTPLWWNPNPQCVRVCDLWDQKHKFHSPHVCQQLQTINQSHHIYHIYIYISIFLTYSSPILFINFFRFLRGRWPFSSHPGGTSLAPRVNNGVSMGCEEIQPEISSDILRQYVRYMIYMYIYIWYICFC